MVPHMAQITLGGNPINTNGDLPAAGATAPDFTLTKADWTPVSAADLAGQRVVMNIFPSLDTGCADHRANVQRACRRPREHRRAVRLGRPAARRCSVLRRRGHRERDHGLDLQESRSPRGARREDARRQAQGLAARSVVVLDTDGTVLHSELVPEISLRTRLRRSDRRPRLIRDHNRIIVVPGPQPRASHASAPLSR